MVTIPLCLLDHPDSLTCWWSRPDEVPGFPRPKRVTRLERSSEAIEAAVEVASHGSELCVVRPSGTVACRRGFLPSGTDNPWYDLGVEHVGSMHAAHDAFCATFRDGAVRCWYRPGARPLTAPPAPVFAWEHEDVRIEGRRVVGASIGRREVCALLDDGGVSCWSQPWLRRSPDAVPGAAEPHPIDLGGQRATALALGLSFGCVVLEDNRVACWRADDKVLDGSDHGWVPSSFPLVDVRLGAPSPVRGIVAGDDHACAWLADGTLRCWGDDDKGQLGGQRVSGSSSPVWGTSVASSAFLGRHAPAVMASASQNDTCALLADGLIRCWGESGEAFSRVPTQAFAPDIGRRERPMAAVSPATSAGEAPAPGP